jgi:quinol monooxygenase YgiN
MIVVAGTIAFDPTSQEAVIAAVDRVSEATRAETGCISYEFFADLAAAGRLHLFEEWEEERHLLAHFETPHLAEFYQQLQAADLTARDITRYHVSSYGPNRPEQDQT